MHVPNSQRPDPPGLGPARAGDGVTARVARFQTDLASRVGDTAWSALHALGAHRWREGYETDPDRGMSRYRGSRCTVCDEPWEGW
jgi:hypothetical protein